MQTNNLKTLRQEKQMRIWQLATLAKTGPATITAIERYNYVPTNQVKEKLANALGTNVEAVWPGNGKVESGKETITTEYQERV